MTRFYNKTGRAIEKIAAELFLYEKGMRIPNITEFQEKFGFARGTVQAAMQYLKKEQAIETISKGHLGTSLTEIDQHKLRKLANVNELKGTLPLPYSKLYEGLATSLYLIFQEQNIKLNLAHMRGSEERVNGVELGAYDFAGVSKYAAEKMIEQGRNIQIISKFGLESYLSKHILLFASKDFTQVEDGMRIGIDNDSLDHVVLTKKLIQNKEVTLIEIPSNQLIYALREKQIDAGIWNYDEIVDKKIDDLSYTELEVKPFHKDISEAVLVARKNDKITKKICLDFVESKRIKEIQKKIKNGEMTPRY